MVKINTPRLTNAPVEYQQGQLDQVIRTIELIIRQLNTTYTKETENRAESFAWYNARY